MIRFLLTCSPSTPSIRRPESTPRDDGGAGGITAFSTGRAGGKVRSRRDDGVCLTTLRDRRAGPVKGGVRRQAPSRLREPLKAVMEPAPPPSRPIPGNIRFRHFCSNRPWNGLERACLRNNSGITRKKVLPAHVISHKNRPYKHPYAHSGY